MPKKIILQPHVGGMGDNILYTTLPERWVREQDAEVFIKNPGFRNDGIPKLIWNTNPFVSGITNESATHILKATEDLRRLCIEHNNNIKGIEAYFNMPPINIYPKLYFQPLYKPELKNITLIDPFSITLTLTKEKFDNFIAFLKGREIIKDNVLILCPGKTVPFAIDEFKTISLTDFDYVSAIYSCKLFITNHSGGAALASAIKGANTYPKIIAVMANSIFNSKIWVWENIQYQIISQLNGDFDLI